MGGGLAARRVGRLGVQTYWWPVSPGYNRQMNARPSIVFDTTGINELENVGSGSEPLMRALECGYDVVLTAMSADEIISTKSPARREALLSRFGRLLYSAQCLWPPHEIIRLLVEAHSRNPVQFDSTRVNVRARAYEEAIPRRDFDDPLCIQQRKEQFRVQEQFETMWKGLRSKLVEILKRDPAKRPTTYQQAVEIASVHGCILSSFGAGLYERVAGKEPTDAEIKAFMDVCPPFRATCYGLVMAWYNGSLRVLDGTPTAKRNDLMMAAYLPYCDKFVTADWAQRKELREIAAEAKIGCEVLSFADFDGSFVVAV
jgi:hypothetical protein